MVGHLKSLGLIKLSKMKIEFSGSGDMFWCWMEWLLMQWHAQLPGRVSYSYGHNSEVLPFRRFNAVKLFEAFSFYYPHVLFLLYSFVHLQIGKGKQDHQLCSFKGFWIFQSLCAPSLPSACRTCITQTSCCFCPCLFFSLWPCIADLLLSLSLSIAFSPLFLLALSLTLSLSLFILLI